VEVIGVMTVAIVFCAIAFAVGKSAIERGYTAEELSAARGLAAAYAAAAADHDGELLPGYDDSAEGYKMPHGPWVSSAAAHRYPFRLAPYFDYNIDGTILLTRNKAQLASLGMPNEEYAASLYPALGMNSTYVGGEYRKGDSGETMDKECATNLSQVPNSSRMLVFASAARKNGDKVIDGYFELVPPNKRVKVWTGSDTVDKEDPSPERYGNVAFRHNGQAVCGFLDGSVRMMGPKELRDMRLWSKNAQIKDNPDYTIEVSKPPPGRGSGR